MPEDHPAKAVESVHEPDAAEGRRIRRTLRALLTGWGLGAEAVEDALLVVEELVANVVDHARTRFRLGVALTGRVLRVSVTDCAAGLPQLRPFDPAASRGRGLQVVATIAQRWGCDRADPCKTVWVELST